MPSRKGSARSYGNAASANLECSIGHLRAAEPVTLCLSGFAIGLAPVAFSLSRRLTLDHARDAVFRSSCRAELAGSAAVFAAE